MEKNVNDLITSYVDAYTMAVDVVNNPKHGWLVTALSEGLIRADEAVGLLNARIAELEAEKRVVFCVHCHEKRSAPVGDLEARRAVLAWITEHEQTCPESPLVQRMEAAIEDANVAEHRLAAAERENARLREALLASDTELAWTAE